MLPDYLNMKGRMDFIDDFILNNYVGELNDEKTRSDGVRSIKDYLSTNGVCDYMVICDERNNPPNIVDIHILRYDVISYGNANDRIDIYKHQLCGSYDAPVIKDYAFE